jgi:indole-3-glycerol phosphate synthase
VTQPTESILDRIVADKRGEVAAARRRAPLARIRAFATAGPGVRPFAKALRRDAISLIAEIKKASPSRGLLREDFDPVALARVYSDAGAAAISVLTDKRHFQGSLAHLAAVRSVPGVLPVLRKDFLFDPYQVYESRARGADAVLLIAAILERELLTDLIALARELGMDSLVEVHDAAEMERALAASATLIGVNNRDLRTFEVDLGTTERLRHMVPSSATLVAESGVSTRADVERLAALGVHAVLIGEALVTVPDPSIVIRELFG